MLGTGVAGFAFEDAARIMIEEIRRHAAAHATPSSFVMYGYARDQADALAALLSSPDPPSAAAP